MFYTLKKQVPHRFFSGKKQVRGLVFPTLFNISALERVLTCLGKRGVQEDEAVLLGKIVKSIKILSEKEPVMRLLDGVAKIADAEISRDKGRAKKLLLEVFDISPEHRLANYVMAKLLITEDKKSDAAKYFRSMIKNDPDDAPFLLDLAKKGISTDKEGYKITVGDVELLKTIVMQSALYYIMNCVKKLIGQGDKGLAVELLQAVIEKFPDESLFKTKYPRS